MPSADPLPGIEVVYQSPPDRLNEDAWLVMQAGPLGERIVFAAIDGATTRLTPPPLQRYLDSQPGPLTPAAYSARFTRDALARHIAEGIFTDPRTLLLETNADLSRSLIALFGALTLESMKFPEEIYATLAHDPRLVRLGLPASVVTLAEYDPATHEIGYAHAGDTLLLAVYQDGRVKVPTHAGAISTNGDLKRIALDLRKIHPDLPLRELIQQPEIRQMTLTNGLYHNYVDEYGLPQPGQGIGVVNGQPELRYFVQTGKFSTAGIAFVCAMTDGLEWPASAQEIFASSSGETIRLAAERWAGMANQIAGEGLSEYLHMLRQAEADDPDFERYPRTKKHDDATGVLLRFS